jgi:hypothetical protein
MRCSPRQKRGRRGRQNQAGQWLDADGRGKRRTFAAGRGCGQRLISALGYDSDPLGERWADPGFELIVPHRRNHSMAATHSGGSSRRYLRRWKIERVWAQLQNYRWIVVRHERYADNHLGRALLGLPADLVALRARGGAANGIEPVGVQRASRRTGWRADVN